MRRSAAFGSARAAGSSRTPTPTTEIRKRVLVRLLWEGGSTDDVGRDAHIAPPIKVVCACRHHSSTLHSVQNGRGKPLPYGFCFIAEVDRQGTGSRPVFNNVFNNSGEKMLLLALERELFLWFV